MSLKNNRTGRGKERKVIRENELEHTFFELLSARQRITGRKKKKKQIMYLKEYGDVRPAEQTTHRAGKGDFLDDKVTYRRRRVWKLIILNFAEGPYGRELF